MLDAVDTGPRKSPVFATTQWSVVLAAGGRDSGDAAEALDKLCGSYWYPLYAFVRRSGYAQHDAEDLTQEFFTRLLEKRYLDEVDPSKGRFRSFLLVRFRNFTLKERREARAQKRGGHCTFISLNDESAEQDYLRSAPVDMSADRLYVRQWATTLLDRVLARLCAEFLAEGKAALFGELKGFLQGDKHAGGYVALAAKLATTEAALKMAVSRMRKRYRQLLRAEIADTVSGPDEVEDEMRALFAALG